jgi:hypothetical protein
MPALNAIGIAVSDMSRSIQFYRLVGLDVPQKPDEGHVDAFLPNGVRFMLDSEDVMRSFMPECVLGPALRGVIDLDGVRVSLYAPL